MLPVAVDAMGGDRAPGDIIAGARCALDDLGIAVVLVGRPERLRGTDGIEVIPASEIIGMADDPVQSVRRKKDASVVRAAEAVRDGRACAMVSAGNTGAAMTSALLRMGRIKGVARPAIATPLPVPVPGAPPTVLLDAGANAACHPEWLVQFAQMGTVFSRERFGVDDPRVGLLSIGEEASKGNALVKEAGRLLVDAPGVNFIGNVEGRDILTEDVDVVVTDGFTGNVVLKTLEGGMKGVVAELRRRLGVGAISLEPFFAELDPENTGGAMLLGVDGVCIIAHGASSPHAVANAIGVAREMVDGAVVQRLRDAIALDTQVTR